MKILILAFATLVLSTNVNASIVNTLNGIDYEWLELTETTGLSRNQVEAQLSDQNSRLYGYQYASRDLMEDLLLSYTSWDGQTGWHTSSNVIQGINAMMSDFGLTDTYNFGTVSQIYTLDGQYVPYDTVESIRGLYGLASECGSGASCFSGVGTAKINNTVTAAYQDAAYGFDATILHPSITDNSASNTNFGSYLVRTAVVPEPASMLLIGSGLAGLAGVAHRRR